MKQIVIFTILGMSLSLMAIACGKNSGLPGAPPSVATPTATSTATSTPWVSSYLGVDFGLPYGVAVDNNTGNIYVTDCAHNFVLKITSGGVISTFAGSGSFGSANGVGTSASFSNPWAVAVDNSGNVYVSDMYTDIIRKITPGGLVSTLAGTPGVVGVANGPGSNATFDCPTGLAVDSSGNVYVADSSSQLIRKITPGGVVSTFAGTAYVFGSMNGIGTTATFHQPNGIAIDNSGNFYVADSGNDLIRKITPGGVVSTFAGTAGVTGSTDGIGTSASFNGPRGVAVDSSGNVYVGDTGNSLIRKITPSGMVSTLAGQALVSGHTDGALNVATFYCPDGVSVDNVGDVYVADTWNDLIRVIHP